MDQIWLDSIRRWKESSIFVVYTFGTASYFDVLGRNRRKGPEEYRTGDLVAAIELCATTTLKQLQQDPDAMQARGDLKEDV
jgi:hypothetical protein